MICHRDEGRMQGAAHREGFFCSLVILRRRSKKSVTSKKVPPLASPFLAINLTSKYFDCFSLVFKPTQWALENNPLIQKEKYHQLISGSYSVFQMRCFAVETNAVIHRLWLCDLHQGLYSIKITDLLSSCVCPQYNLPLTQLEGIFSGFWSIDVLMH